MNKVKTTILILSLIVTACAPRQSIVNAQRQQSEIRSEMEIQRQIRNSYLQDEVPANNAPRLAGIY